MPVRKAPWFPDPPPRLVSGRSGGRREGRAGLEPSSDPRCLSIGECREALAISSPLLSSPGPARRSFLPWSIIRWVIAEAGWKVTTTRILGK